MNQHIIPRSNKLIAGIIFLYIAFCISQLNIAIVIANQTKGVIHNHIYWFFIILTAEIWLTYKIYRGSSLSRFILLAYEIFNCIITVINLLPFNSTKLIFSLHAGLELVCFFIGFILLFSQDSSNWFKQVNQGKSNRLNISLNIIIVSICLYIAYAIGVINWISYSFNLYSEKEYGSCFIYILKMMFHSVACGAFNILFIYSISKGSKLSGIIYLILIIIAELLTINSIQKSFGSRTTYSSNWGILAYIQFTIQMFAFILLFQKEIISLYNKFTRKEKNTISQ